MPDHDSRALETIGGAEAPDAPPRLSFVVVGHPMPGGSKKGFLDPKTKRVVVVEDSKNKPWRRAVAKAAAAAMPAAWSESPWFAGPVIVRMTFVRVRPKSHYRTGRFSDLLRPDAPEHPIVAPDVLKLARAAEDAMSGIVYRDDAQIIDERLVKRFGMTEGLIVTVVPVATGPVEVRLDLEPSEGAA